MTPDTRSLLKAEAMAIIDAAEASEDGAFMDRQVQRIAEIEAELDAMEADDDLQAIRSRRPRYV